jgi:hypothetical protein
MFVFKYKFSCLIAFICIFLASCSPNSLEDCLLDAAKLPTQAGINLAESACHSKFKKPLTEVEKIINNSVKCDTQKLEEYARFIVINKNDKGKEDFEKVAKEYIDIREACKVLEIK